MFHKGVLNSYDSNKRKGTILLENEDEVQFLVEDLSSMMVNPVIGERVRCIVVEKKGKKHAKCIIRRDHRNARIEKPVNKIFYSDVSNLKQLKEKRHANEKKIAKAAIDQKEVNISHSDHQTNHQKSAEQKELQVRDIISETDEKRQYDLAQTADQELRHLSSLNVDFKIQNIEDESRDEQIIKDIKASDLKHQPEGLVQNFETETKVHNEFIDEENAKPTALNANSKIKKDDIFSFELTDEDVKEPTIILNESIKDETENSISENKVLEIDDSRLELGEPIFSVIGHNETQQNEKVVSDQDAEIGIPVLDYQSLEELMEKNKADQPLNHAEPNIFQVQEDQVFMQNEEKEHHHTESQQEFEIQKLASDTLRSAQPETQKPEPQYSNHAQAEMNADNSHPLGFDQFEYRWHKFKMALLYKKYKPTSVQKSKHIQRDKNKFNPWIIVSVIALLVIGNLVVIGYQKIQAYQVEQQTKSQLYLIEQQRAIEEQRSKLGNLPDKILSDETLDELLGKDRHESSNQTAKKANTNSISTNTMSDQQIAAMQYSCDGRTHCSQMKSYEEAVFFLKNCPNTQMDGNNDGEPCERQFGR